MAVGVGKGVGVGGLGNHGVFAVGVGYIAQHRGKVVKTAVPVGVVGGCVNVVVNLIFVEKIGKVFNHACFFGIGKVQRYKRVFVEITNGF